MKYIKSLYLTNRFFYGLAIIAVVLVAGFFVPVLFAAGKATLYVYGGIAVVDILMLYSRKTGINASRTMADKLSNGDPNPILVEVESRYPFLIYTEVIDEVPEQFQYRKNTSYFSLKADAKKQFTYELRPHKRGEYTFNKLNVFASTLLGLVNRRFTFDAEITVPVYPSYIQMHKYELLAISNRLVMAGIKKIRRIGHNFEFEQIRDYVQGDDFRTINWKATARKGGFMVNQYQDEKSQQVYSIIDKGRVMKMPFEGLSLMDYAINSSLVISNIAIKKYDKAGLITFTEEKVSILQAERKPDQMGKILETLYAQKTRYLEANHELLYATIRRQIKQRSLLLFYTNFESMTSLRRYLPFFRGLAKNHLLVVIFFENTELEALTQDTALTLEDVYIKTIAEKMMYEKRQIVAELLKYGIQSILTPPQDLSVNTINKYLELKSRGLI
ncbi:MAG: DUF58 domain-containing protein [Bacteroidetes bacterium]|nr:MAG: DUF58 domain-containing protein [Bacteroidota bacterium]